MNQKKTARAPFSKFEKSIKELEVKTEALSEKLATKREVIETRRKILIRIIADLETDNKISSTERINRFEGYYSYIVSYKLEDIIEERNWVVGVILSAEILDDVGKRKLRRQFKGRIDPGKIENLRFEETIMMLLASGLITPKTYQKLMEIRKVRNDLAHDSMKTLEVLMQTGSKNREDRKCKSAIEKAIFCLKTISPPLVPLTHPTTMSRSHHARAPTRAQTEIFNLHTNRSAR